MLSRGNTLNVALIYPPEAGIVAMSEAAEMPYGMGEQLIEKGKLYREILDFTYTQIGEQAMRGGKKTSASKVETFTHEEKPMYPIMSPRRLQAVEDADLIVSVDPHIRLTAYLQETVKGGIRNRALIAWTNEQVYESIERLLSLRQTPLVNPNPDESHMEGLRVAYGFHIDPYESEIDWKLRSLMPTKHAVHFPYIPGEKHEKEDMFALKPVSIDAPESQKDFRHFLVEAETDAKEVAEREEFVRRKIKELGLE